MKLTDPGKKKFEKREGGGGVGNKNGKKVGKGFLGLN